MTQCDGREIVIEPMLDAYWATDADELAHQLATSATAGLSTGEAQARLAIHGENRVADGSEAGALRLIARQVESPLVLILVFGACVSLALREWTDALIILTIIAGSAILGFTQEYRASRAMLALRQRISLSSSVIRDGRLATVQSSHIVSGDIVELSAGNLVPADGIVLEARDFLVSEAALTGESFPVEKQPGISAVEAALPKRTNALFLGTSVRSGTARMLVVATGVRSELGRISSRLVGNETETEFARGLRQFGYLLTRVMIGVVLFALTINLLANRPAIDSLLFAVALAVGLSPELLPAIVSVTLSVGARKMAQDGVLVRRLDAIENLGSISVLCTDKTGTLTTGNVQLADACDANATTSPEILRLAFLNSCFETGIVNPLDQAIVAAGKQRGLTTDGTSKLDEIPYDFLRRRLSIAFSGLDDISPVTLVTKGAVANVISCCSTLATPGGTVALTLEAREAIDGLCSEKAKSGFRVLALATRELPRRATYDRHDETGMVFRGLLLFMDPVKPGMGETLADLRTLGVATKIITGDSRHVAAHVGAEIGLDCQQLITGEELNRIKDEALWHLADHVQIFAEIDPQQKERIVRALQKRGHAVGFLGDGINDAPALLAADVGISVEGAVDVARESADVVMLVRELEVLKGGILQGRRTFANTLKYIKITVSANFGNMVSMALATLWLPFLPMTAKQILLNNFLSDFPSLAVSSDNLDVDAFTSAQRWSIDEVRRFMIVFGLVSTAFDLMAFGLLQWGFGAVAAEFQTAWFVISLLTELAALLILRTQRSVLTSRPGRLLGWTSLAIALVALSAPYLGSVSASFGFVPVPAVMLASLLGIVMAYAIATEFTKRRLSTWHAEGGRHAMRPR